MDSPYSVLTRISYTGVHRIPFTRIGSFFKSQMLLPGFVWTGSLQCSYQDFVHWGPQAHRKAKRGVIEGEGEKWVIIFRSVSSTFSQV